MGKLVDPFKERSQGLIDPFKERASTPALVTEKETERSWGEAIKDLGYSFGSGAGALLNIAGNIYGLAAGDMDNIVSLTGESARDYWNKKKSPGLKALEQRRQQRVEAADGEWSKAGVAFWETLSNPELLTSFLFEQAPMLMPVMGVGRVAGAGAQALGAGARGAGLTGTGAAIGTGAAMQGSDAGQQAYEKLMDLPDELWATNDRYRAGESKDDIALDLARNAAIQSAVVSGITNVLPGSRTLERVLAGARPTGAVSGRLFGAAKGFVGEGLQEAIEEGHGAYAANIAAREVDPFQDPYEGVGEAAGVAAASGFFGLGAGVVEGAARDAADVMSSPTVDDAIQVAADSIDGALAGSRARLEEGERPVVDFQPIEALEAELGIAPSEVEAEYLEVGWPRQRAPEVEQAAELLPEVERQAAQMEADRPRFNRKLDARDEFLVWMAKRKPLSRKEGEAWGLDPEMMKAAKFGTLRPFRVKNGATVDDVVEAAIEDGWLPEGSTEADLKNMLDASLAGEGVYKAEGAQWKAERDRIDYERDRLMAALDVNDEYDGADLELLADNPAYDNLADEEKMLSQLINTAEAYGVSPATIDKALDTGSVQGAVNYLSGALYDERRGVQGEDQEGRAGREAAPRAEAEAAPEGEAEPTGRVIRTADGYRFHELSDGTLVDNLDPAQRDLTFTNTDELTKGVGRVWWWQAGDEVGQRRVQQAVDTELEAAGLGEIVDERRRQDIEAVEGDLESPEGVGAAPEPDTDAPVTVPAAPEGEPEPTGETEPGERAPTEQAAGISVGSVVQQIGQEGAGKLRYRVKRIEGDRVVLGDPLEFSDPDNADADQELVGPIANVTLVGTGQVSAETRAEKEASSQENQRLLDRINQLDGWSAEAVYEEKENALRRDRRINQVRARKKEGRKTGDAVLVYSYRGALYVHPESGEDVRWSNELERVLAAPEQAARPADVILTPEQQADPELDEYGQVIEKPGETYEEYEARVERVLAKYESIEGSEDEGGWNDWDITVENFPEPTRTVNADKDAGDDWISKEEGDRIVDGWKAEAKRLGEEEFNAEMVVVSLFDESGELAKPWEEAGYTVIQQDIKLGDDLIETSPNWIQSELDALRERGINGRVVAVLAQPPCTCFSSSGARWWKERHDAVDARMVNRMFGEKASYFFNRPVDYTKALVSMVDLWVDFNNPDIFMLENPIGRIGKESGLPKPTLRFNPNTYGDPYTKRTQLWGKFNTSLPTANVEPTEGSLMHKLWSSAEKEGGLRSLTPEGFSYAFFMANHASAKGTLIDRKRGIGPGASQEQVEAEPETDLFGETPIQAGPAPPVTAATTLEGLARQIKSDTGATIDLSRDEDTGAILVDSLRTEKAGRGRGAGSRAMQSLIDWADANGEELLLFPAPESGADEDVARLQACYERFGFTGDRGVMSRQPKAATPAEAEPDVIETAVESVPRGTPLSEISITEKFEGPEGEDVVVTRTADNIIADIDARLDNAKRLIACVRR